MESIKDWMKFLYWNYGKLILRSAQQKINQFQIRKSQLKQYIVLKTIQ